MSSDQYDRSAPPERRRRRDAATDAAECAELARHYQFVPAAPPPPGGDGRATTTTTTWQERMVRHYHQHLYKEYVLADLRCASEGRLGLRWRTAPEVAQGKGSRTCGNKHCPSHTRPCDKDLPPAIAANEPSSKRERAERQRLLQMSYGDDQTEFEVPFSYHEHGHEKTELVKLRLCAKCAPLLCLSKGKRDPCLMARGIASEKEFSKRPKSQEAPPGSSSSVDGDEKRTRRKRQTHATESSSTSSEDSYRKRRKHERQRSRQHRS